MITPTIDLRCMAYSDLLPTVPSDSVSLVVLDPPYGVTKNRWDQPFPMQTLWPELWRVAKQDAPVVVFAQGAFAADMIVGQRKAYRYDLIWRKNRPSGHLNAKKMPMRDHEQLLVFYRKPPTYYPQMISTDKPTHSRGKGGDNTANNYGANRASVALANEGLRYPRSVLEFDRPHPPQHPTQKPVALVAWLIRSFTLPGDLVLDISAGVGTTAVAAKQEGRHFVGCEVYQPYWQFAQLALGSV